MEEILGASGAMNDRTSPTGTVASQEELYIAQKSDSSPKNNVDMMTQVNGLDYFEYELYVCYSRPSASLASKTYMTRILIYFFL